MSEKIDQAINGNFLTKLKIYGAMSGPGWIQAAVTLGGGSLIGALYLGVIGGYEFMWLQPLAMLCGIIMLSAISYVTLSTGERPFRTVQKKVSPTLAWGWLIATVVADTVFCAAQFALGRGALEQNLGVPDTVPYLITGTFFVISLSLLWLMVGGGKAGKVVDNLLKVLVAIIVLAFMGVVITLTLKGAVNWSYILKGLIPDFSALFQPTKSIGAAISATGPAADYWSQYVTDNQRNIIITAFGTAVGINMTFLLPYTLRRKGWGKKHRELSRFDLMLGLFVPFILGTSFLVISSAASFHAKYQDVLSEDGQVKEQSADIYYNIVDAKLGSANPDFATLSDAEKQTARESLPLAEKKLAAMLVKRDAGALAKSLEPFLGKYAQLIFGIGILAMAISTMLVHMMMNGYAISEAFNKVDSKLVFMAGAAMPAIAGFFSPFLWSGASKAALAVPASVIATTLLPIAYLAFLLLMNSKAALGEELPKKRALVNVLMIISAGAATFASIWNLVNKGPAGMYGLVGLAVLATIGIYGFVKNNKLAS
ncbi:divalent metal cation transporter [Persicirhabdus sediminis]|uniref:Divalent metal cation transporter n=1 Tax=Persicirhabdus sediminis TaxID=454144 RepID=A0A8J7SH59_9BACT|nr:divalent metal cation transporter [Persicirhabdus sediminis]MBK1790575.1 divalent metal cation transporter [Persicirhabdus sediminis]